MRTEGNEMKRQMKTFQAIGLMRNVDIRNSKESKCEYVKMYA